STARTTPPRRPPCSPTPGPGPHYAAGLPRYANPPTGQPTGYSTSHTPPTPATAAAYHTHSPRPTCPPTPAPPAGDGTPDPPPRSRLDTPRTDTRHSYTQPACHDDAQPAGSNTPPAQRPRPLHRATIAARPRGRTQARPGPPVIHYSRTARLAQAAS